MSAFLILTLSFLCIRKTVCPKTTMIPGENSDSYEENVSVANDTTNPGSLESEKSSPECENRQDVYLLMANSENVLYRKYLEMHRLPSNAHDLYLYEQIRKHWAFHTSMENTFPSEKSKKSKKYTELIKFEQMQQEKFREKLKKPFESFPQFDLDHDLKDFTEEIYKVKEEIIKSWGIPKTVSTQEKLFYEAYEAEMIYNEIHDEVVLKAKIESHIPHAHDIKKLAEDLRNYSTKYDKKCSEYDFFGLNLLYKKMYEHIVFLLKFENFSKNYEYFSFCGPAFLNQYNQIECQKAKFAFPFLTLSHFKYIVGNNSE